MSSELVEMSSKLVKNLKDWIEESDRNGSLSAPDVAMLNSAVRFFEKIGLGRNDMKPVQGK